MQPQFAPTPKPQDRAPGGAPAAQSATRGTILAVDDGSPDQAAALGLLQSSGYRVVRAVDAQAALRVLQDGTHVDLLLADTDLPGPLRSPELAQHARQLNPGIAVLLTSAQGNSASGQAYGAGVELLARPYRPDELARGLRHLLANQQQVNALATALREARRAKAQRRPAGRDANAC
jgi:CheY-like chemotaxis protein